MPGLWQFTSVLTAGMAGGTAAQFFFGVLAAYIINDFDITRSQLGLLTTVCFIFGGGLSPVVGGLVDRIGARRVFVGAMATMAGATMIMATAPNYFVLLAGSALSGVALACCNPTTNKLISEHLGRKGRGLIIGIKQSGVQMGAFVVGLVIPSLAGAIGWRGALAATILVPAGAAAGALGFVPRDSGVGRGVQRTRGGPVGATVRWMTVYSFLMGGGVAATSAYLPLFAREEIEMGVGTGGLLIGVVGLIGVLSRIGWGYGADRLQRIGMPLMVMAVGAFAAALLVLLSLLAGPWVLWIAAALFGLTAVSWNSIAMLVIVSEVAREEAGRASGNVLTGFYLGFVVTPILFGYSVDETGTYTAGWLGIALLFAVAIGVTPLWKRATERERARQEKEEPARR